MSTVIKGGTIVTSDLTYKSDVLVENGKISSIGKNISGDKVIDASGCYIMPGGIDPHTHMECHLWVLFLRMTLNRVLKQLFQAVQQWL